MRQTCNKKYDSYLRVEKPNHDKTVDSAKKLQENRPNVHLLSNIFGMMDIGRLLYADYNDFDI